VAAAPGHEHENGGQRYETPRRLHGADHAWSTPCRAAGFRAQVNCVPVLLQDQRTQGPNDSLKVPTGALKGETADDVGGGQQCLPILRFELFGKVKALPADICLYGPIDT